MHILRVAAWHDDHHLAGVHPVTRAMWLEQSIGDAEQNWVDEHLVGKSLRTLCEASEPLGLFSPKMIDELVTCLWANVSRHRC